MLAHHHRGGRPARRAGHPVGTLGGSQERVNGERQQCVAEENSELAHVEPVEHERVDGVEQSGAEPAGSITSRSRRAVPVAASGKKIRAGMTEPACPRSGRGGYRRSRTGLRRSARRSGRRPLQARSAGAGPR